MIDKQQVAAVKLGYTFAEGQWMEPGHGVVAPTNSPTARRARMKIASWRPSAMLSRPMSQCVWPKGRVEGGKG